ncbi:YHYH domain-containing protein [Sphingobium sp. ZW T5_29]|uniref:YHYH domain-containing protein n=1 Tax=Sphingobium sp. ZW T5_29 TaxID=3378077 RepID=UPI0038544C1F
MKKMIATMVLCAFAATGALAHESTENNRPKPAEEAAKVQAPAKGEGKPKAHSGGTDSNGCHTNHSTGDYHCHNPK